MKVNRHEIIKELISFFDVITSVVEKQIPMKATYSSPLWYICPKCGGSISIENIQEHICDVDTTYCEHCGQAIDWSESDGK